MTADNVMDVIKSVCAADAHLITDTGVLSRRNVGMKHSLVNHTTDEYVRYEEVSVQRQTPSKVISHY